MERIHPNREFPSLRGEVRLLTRVWGRVENLCRLVGGFHAACVMGILEHATRELSTLVGLVTRRYAGDEVDEYATTLV